MSTIVINISGMSFCKLNFLKTNKSITTICRCFASNTQQDYKYYEDLRKKIIFNSHLTKMDGSEMSYFSQRRKRFEQMRKDFDSYSQEIKIEKSIALKYIINENENSYSNESPTTPSTPANFPFQQKQNFTVVADTISQNNVTNRTADNIQWLSSSEEIFKKLVADKNWLPHHPDMANDAIEVDGENMHIRYGTVDPEIPVSGVPCGGCGALLHCQETSIPGFVPKEIFHGLNKHELRTLVCQRCHFLKEFNIAVGVDVSPDDYPKILSHLTNKKALVILMVDLLDLPCSIWPGIVDIIGHQRPIVVVANKIDLIMQDSYDFFDNVKASVRECLLECGIPGNNIKHIELISAKTGFGIESLITEIHDCWRYQGDIYILGCTNVGKSSLFNTLIQSDLCKVQAVDVLQRATVSEWPGTTLNLLKFPILRPSHWRVWVRKGRLLSDSQKEVNEVVKQGFSRRKRYEKQTPHSGYVGRSFVPEAPVSHTLDPFSVAMVQGSQGTNPLGIDPNNEVYAESKWCYDTPGVVHPDQALNMLTTQEIVATIPKKMIVPRVIHFQPGYSLLIAGLARLDFIKGPDFVWFTVFTADTLPLTVTKTEDVDAVYDQLLGTELLSVPRGDSSRLEKWPKLRGKTLEITGKAINRVCSDLVLSSAGWVSVTLEPAEFCLVKAWTPEGRGIHLRLPYVKKAHLFRASKIKGTPVFRPRLKVVNE